MRENVDENTSIGNLLLNAKYTAAATENNK